METASPPVSPSVVARIFMIQKVSVTCGTLLGAWSRNSVVIVRNVVRRVSSRQAQACSIRLQTSRFSSNFHHSRKGLHMTPNQHLSLIHISEPTRLLSISY